MEPWAPGAKCYVCGRLVAEVSAWQDDDGGRWNAHWDCHQRAELKERARQAGSDESLRSMRGRLAAYTRCGDPSPRNGPTPSCAGSSGHQGNDERWTVAGEFVDNDVGRAANPGRSSTT
jgi:hypothetical protein